MPLFNLAGKYTDVLQKGFQGVRDFALDRFVPRPEALFIRAMTGGGPAQTTMTPTELGKIKDAFQTQKRAKLIDPQEAFKQANKEYTDFVNSGSPFASLLIPPTLEGAQQAYAKAKAEQEDPVTSLYGHGRDMKMAYGNLSVYPQPDGGVRIYDRWKVDKNIGGREDETDRVGDLMEGGPVASLVYTAANKLGTYKPFDIDVTVPGEEWKKIKPISVNHPGFESDSPEEIQQQLLAEVAKEQGGFLYSLNKLYNKFKPKPPFNTVTSANPGAFADLLNNSLK